jgi:bifunctional DNA-binding transcriptional regulator/antitoxin component of YhaV-PrlF toxin-antitoxin module
MAKTTWTLSVDEEGVTTFPDELIRIMGWEAGTELVWNYLPDGSITLCKATESDSDTTLPESKS